MLQSHITQKAKELHKKNNKTVKCDFSKGWFQNFRSPGYACAIQSISDIWHAFPSEQIISSFEWCGITGSREITALHAPLRTILSSDEIV